MRPRARTPLMLMLVLVMLGPSLAAASIGVQAWGNGSSSSTTYQAYGIHDLGADIALRDMQISNYSTIRWASGWYLLNGSDWGPSFNASGMGPSKGDNFLAWTDDPDSAIMDWDNHTLYLHPRPTWQPAKGDAERRVWELYNLTRDGLYSWMLNGSQQDPREHLSAYYAALMSHYLLDITQFGHTDWTKVDHSHPAYDPDDATYHSYYESQVWSDAAIDRLYMELVRMPVPTPQRVSDPAGLVHDLASYVNSRDGTTQQFNDCSTVVTVGSTYAEMLTTFKSNWDAGVAFHGIRGYDDRLWNLTVEDLEAGIGNLTSLWYSAYLDAQDRFVSTAPDLVVESFTASPPSGPVPGVIVQFDVTLRNNGSMPTGDFHLQIFSNHYFGEEIMALAPGEEANVTMYWTAVEGSFVFTAWADPYYNVVESNRMNNQLEIAYDVVPVRYGSSLTADPSALYIQQENTGVFNLTLHNTGTRPDLFTIGLTTGPGSVDFSITIHVDELLMGVNESRTFKAYIAIPLNATPGRSDFTIIAVGRNSSAAAVCTVVVVEAQLPPFIELTYGKYANLSVPHMFDASRSWDHNGDPIDFTWDFGDGTTGHGPVVEHAYSGVGIFRGTLDASDGTLHRRFVFEVSVIDAIPPRETLRLLDVDADAAIVGWASWYSEHYFAGYRLYASSSPDSDALFSDRNLLWGSTDPRDDRTALGLPWNTTSYVGLELVNTFGLAVRSEVLPVTTHVRAPAAPGPDLGTWVAFRNVDRHDFEATWPAWDRLYVGGPVQNATVHYSYRLELFVLAPAAGPGGNQSWTGTPWSLELDLSQTSHVHHFNESSENGTVLMLVVAYEKSWPSGSQIVLCSGIVRLPADQRPVVQAAPDLRARAGERLAVEYRAQDPDGRIVKLTLDWGDGSPVEELGGVLGLHVANHTYAKDGRYLVTLRATDDDGAVGATTVAVDVGPKAEREVSLTVPLLVAAIAALCVLVLPDLYYRRRYLKECEMPPEAPASQPLGPPQLEGAPANPPEPKRDGPA